MKIGCFLALTFLLGIPSAASGAYLSADVDQPIEVHGFASPGAMLSTGGINYLVMSSDGTFEFTEIGINFTKVLAEKLRFGLQLFTRDIGLRDSYRFNADWFYLDYRWRDWLGIRAGRVKIPFGFYNDIEDIDAARVPIMLPQSLYPVQNRDFLLAQTGMEVYGYLDLDSFGGLDYRAYFGTIYLNLSSATLSGPLRLERLWTRFIAGGRLLWDTPVEGLRFGGTVQALQLDSQILANLIPTAPQMIEMNIPALLWVASVEYAKDNLLVQVEYSRWHVRVDSNDEAIIPDSTVLSERAYAMVAYHVTPWLQPALYYSMLFPTVKQRHGRANQQNDVSLTLRFDVMPHWLVKLEGHYMNGTAYLDPELNNNQPLGTLPENWGLFLVKSTAYF